MTTFFRSVRSYSSLSEESIRASEQAIKRINLDILYSKSKWNFGFKYSNQMDR
jgi:hypothetical protein